MPSLSQEIKFNTPLHKRIVEAIQARVRLSSTKVQTQEDKWRRAEETYLAYTKETENDAKRRQLRDDGHPQAKTIVVPYSYATLLAAHTYWCGVFLSRNPILQFSGRHGETEQQVLALEAVMDYQVTVGYILPKLYGWLLDPGKYGFGVVGLYWDRQESTISRIEEQQVTMFGFPVEGKTKKVRVTENALSYLGNTLFNIQPRDFLPDVRVPLNDLQKGEYAGHRFEMSWNEIVRRKMRGEYFNTDVLQRMRKRGRNSYDAYEVSGSSQLEEPEEFSDLDTMDIKDVGIIKGVEMTIELIPRAWGLGNSTTPEKWTFTLAENQVLIGARPQGAYHNKYPYFIQEYELDPYSLFSRGMMETLQPLQDLMNWLFNSHIFNVRKVLNGEMIVDPSRVVMKDVKDPTEGRIIRLKPSAYGTDAREAVHQLQVTDVTQTHVADSQMIADLYQRVTGVNDNIMGMINQGGRKSATEIRSSTGFGVNRLKTQAEMFSAQAWTPLSMAMVQNTQQYYDIEQKFKIAGDLIKGRTSFVDVNPMMLQGFYDFVPVDGTLPVDRYAQANLWREFLMGIFKVPQIAQTYDLAGIFGWVAKLAGLKNVDQFRIDVVPDEQAMMDAERGNVVPIREQDPNSLDNSPEPGQVSGVGATG